MTLTNCHWAAGRKRRTLGTEGRQVQMPDEIKSDHWNFNKLAAWHEQPPVFVNVCFPHSSDSGIARGSVQSQSRSKSAPWQNTINRNSGSNSGPHTASRSKGKAGPAVLEAPWTPADDERQDCLIATSSPNRGSHLAPLCLHQGWNSLLENSLPMRLFRSSHRKFKRQNLRPHSNGT